LKKNLLNKRKRLIRYLALGFIKPLLEPITASPPNKMDKGTDLSKNE
jgi:hypothetical protein